jgi:hypothetical protein
MTFWGGSGSGSSDPCFWLMDPDPAIFVIDLQDASKKLISNSIFSAYYFLKVHLYHFSKIKSQKSHKYLWLVDPDPGGLKTCGSVGSGSGSGSGSTTLHYLNLRSLRQISSSFVHGQTLVFSSFLSWRKGIRLIPDPNPEPFKKDHLIVQERSRDRWQWVACSTLTARTGDAGAATPQRTVSSMITGTTVWWYSQKTAIS